MTELASITTLAADLDVNIYDLEISHSAEAVSRLAGELEEYLTIFRTGGVESVVEAVIPCEDAVSAPDGAEGLEGDES